MTHRSRPNGPQPAPPRPGGTPPAPLPPRERDWQRAVIEQVTPQVDGGRFPVKRCLGDTVIVEADAFADGHDQLRVRLWSEPEAGDGRRTEVDMTALGNDRWQGRFLVDRLGRFRYGVIAWVDDFLTWRHDLGRRGDPADVASALQVGARILRAAATRARAGHAGRSDPDPAAADRLDEDAGRLVDDAPLDARRALALADALAERAMAWPDRRDAARSEPDLTVVVDPVRARCSAWYELFPRSLATETGRHGSFADVVRQLPRIAGMGFDVLYLPPVHPIGRIRRKGPNNALVAGPDDPGSPWAIGSAEGGHRTLHPALGTEADFRALIEAARAHGIAIALDIAFQCAPDHPAVEAHPEWFRHRPDGSVQYAENPPKKYQDIYPFDFDSGDWHGLFRELLEVFLHWIDRGVEIFRVDNPHTKPFAFWEWVIGEVKRRHPQVIFLSEAFTRPRVMHRLAKVGFSQSYTYFTWRNSPAALTEYLTELTQSPSREYMRPNLWPNTPDILPEALQIGGRPAYMARLVLAATLGANYGIYGPAFELMESTPREPGSEEYLDSEKYQIRQRDPDAPHGLSAFIARVNRIRRENPALAEDWNLRFHPVDNDQILCYSKTSADGANRVVCAVNLDFWHTQSGWVHLPVGEPAAAGGRPQDGPVQVHDLLSDQRFLWTGDRHFLRLDPARSPAQVFLVRRRVRSEHQFDYFL